MTTERHAFLALRRRLPGAYLVRVENAAGVGLPDVYGAYKGTSFWVELKVVGRRGLSPSQRAVCTRLARAGVLVFVAYYDGKRLDVRRFWEEGISLMKCQLPGEPPHE